MLRLLCLCLMLFLCGCGTYYTVSVDSLRNDGPSAEDCTFVLAPGEGLATEDPLLFQDVAAQIRTAFAARGYAVVEGDTQAPCVALLSFGEGEPQIRLENSTQRRSVPVSVRHGKRTRIEYVYVDEPVVVARTIYSAYLFVEAFSLSPQGKPEQPLWRTRVTSSGVNSGFRTHFATMLPALSLTLGTRTDGYRNFEIFVKDGGEVSMDEIAAR